MNEIYKNLSKSKEKELSLVEDKIKIELSNYPSDISSFFENFLFNSPKRLRPLFIFLVCDHLNLAIDDDVVNLAVSVELLHSASLIHDDILDDGTIRRKMKCIHLDMGYKMGVLAGDYLLSLSMSALSRLNNKKVFEIMSNASYLMTKSEINALNKRYKLPDLNSYIETSKEKTASLFVASIKALSEIKNIKVDEKLIKFTENFALCFQIKDDINNFLNKDENKISSDKSEGVYTLPLILNSCGIIDDAIDFLNNFISETEKLINCESKLFHLLDLFRVRI